MNQKKDIKLLKKCLKKSEQCTEYFTLCIEKMILCYGVVADDYVCLPVYIGNDPYRIYRYGKEGLTYITKCNDVREVNTLGRLIQAMKLMLDSLESGKY